MRRLLEPWAPRLVPLMPSRFKRFAPAQTWGDAEASSSGYASVVPSADPGKVERAVLNKSAQGLISAFGVALALGARPTDSIEVVDFGGGTGKSAHLVRRVFPALRFHWSVVEQPHVVDAMLQAPVPNVEYLSDLNRALDRRPSIILASASLNYISDPLNLLRQFCEASDVTILNRLPLWPLRSHSAAVQCVGRDAHDPSYPTWFSAEEKFRATASKLAEIVYEFESPGDRAYFRGTYRTYSGMVHDNRGLRGCRS